MDLPQLLAAAEQIARTVGARMREVAYGSGARQVQFKGLTDLVTEIDFWAEQQIRDALLPLDPSAKFLGEESADALAAAERAPLAELASTGTWWVVDPLDGTANFVNRIPHSAVSIGLLRGGERILGLVFDPFRDELFTAIRGAGARLNGAPISAADKHELIAAVLGTGFPHDHQDRWELYQFVHDAAIRKFRKVRVFGSAAIEQCWVACGRLDGFVEYGLKPWDVCAGSLIVEEAGGVAGSFVNAVGEPYSIFHPSLAVAGKNLYPALYTVMHEADAEGRRRFSLPNP